MEKFKGLLCGVRKKKKQKDEVPYIEEEGKSDDNCSNLNKDCKDKEQGDDKQASKDKEQGDDKQASKVINININAGSVSIAGGIIREKEEHSDGEFESGSNSAVVKDQLLTEVFTPVNITEKGLPVTSSQDSGSEEVFPTTSKDSEKDIHACKSEIKQIDETQDLPKTLENNKFGDSIFEEEKGDKINWLNHGMTDDFKNIKAEAQQPEFSETAQKRNDCLSETVEEDGSSLSITNCNNVEKLTQFSNVSKRPSTSESLPEANSTSDSQMFGSHGGQDNLSGLNIEDRSQNIGPGQSCAATDHMSQDQSSSPSVNIMLSAAGNGDTDQATQEEENRSGEDDVDPDAEVYNTATISEQKEEITEKKGVDGAFVSDVIKEISNFGKDSMGKNFDIAMTPESNNEVKIEMGHEIGNTGRSVANDLANVAIQGFQS
ncbi:unnamed protein product [Mytilus coruscus]|uniref:Uncharacterized protein n=1 Tax=Mytilus coruscus TaxID=42192 RepID=A0A6J8ATT6_MYTCO|nr:unnamed protein product [Mytilus coruscus]CAC5372063.1 unnamed protein product [Mytilus coruscus]CAC5372064.1 unnamed protein product [Mytilus coruscus]